MEQPMEWSRLGKKRDMPGGLWLKCESCAQMIFRKELESRHRVCPTCNFHFTLGARERFEITLDPGTFEEKWPDLTPQDRLKFTDTIKYSDKVIKTREKSKLQEAIIAATGEIKNRPVVMAVLDFGFMGGSMGEVVGEKVARSCELGIETGRPVILFTSSGGARMHEGAVSLMQMAKTCGALSRLRKAGGFSISCMTNPTTGGVTASFASVCDILLAEPGALIGFAGPRVISTTLKQELPKGFQRAEFLIEKGQIDAIVSRDKMRDDLARLLSYYQPAVKAVL
ncbi:MAG: acetyl-CoA carboxylase carboxyltransferase subunit beta [Planctomycetes bacterium]|nr:acetyl-CoA carboxylase carboxyltransferase subunit beta [Planctomycetota bacterium]